MEGLNELLAQTRRIETQSARVIATAFYRLNEVHQTANWAYPTFDVIKEATLFDTTTGDLLKALSEPTSSVAHLHQLVSDGVLAEAATILCETEILIGCALVEHSCQGQVSQREIHAAALKDDRLARIASIIARSSLTSAAPINYLLAERLVDDSDLLTLYEDSLVDSLEAIYSRLQTQ